MSNAYETIGDFSRALKVLDDNIELYKGQGLDIPADLRSARHARLKKLCADLTPWAKTRQFQETYKKAMASFDHKDYSNAITFFSTIIDKEKGIAKAYEKRAFSYFYLEQFQLSLADINRAIALDSSNPLYYNFRGVNYHVMGNISAACADFQAAIAVYRRKSRRQEDFSDP